MTSTVEFIELLEKSDQQQLDEIRRICQKMTSSFLERIADSDRAYHQECKKMESDRIENCYLLDDQEYDKFVAEIYEVDRQNPELDSVARELSTELALSQRKEELDARRATLRKHTSTLDEHYEKLLQQNLDKFRVLAISDDQEFLRSIDEADKKFRIVLGAKMAFPRQPMSFALRDTLIADRNDRRKFKCDQYFAAKKLANAKTCEKNQKNNDELFEKIWE